MLANLLQDLRYSLHGFALRPVFAATVVLTLALGIGVNVAVFSLYDQIMLRELPVSRPDELVKVVSPGPRVGNQLANQQGGDDQTFSYPLFRELEAAGDADVDLAASWIVQVSLRYQERTVRRSGVLVTGDYFAALGVGPELGRLLGAQDVVDAQPPETVVLSFDYWTTAFAADPSVVGKTLVVSGRSLEVVGVAPRGFVGMTPGVDAAVFVPVTLEWYRNASLPTPILEDRFFSYLYVFGRLRPGVSLEAAQGRLDAAFRSIVNDVEAPAAATRPRFNKLEEFRARTLLLSPAARGQSRAPDYARTPLAIFFAATATILLIACVNLANLMFARAATRIREIAVRASLGAARRRLYSLLSVEALLLAGIAGVFSLPVALGVLRAVDVLQPPGLDVKTLAAIDLRMTAAAFAIAVFAAVAFAVTPMIKVVGTDPARALHVNGTRSFGGKSLGRFRFALAATQIALSMSLLVLASLFVQSLLNAARVELGFRTESIVTFQASPGVNGYSAERSAEVMDAIVRELAAQPGVIAVSTAGVPLLSDSQWRTTVSVEGVEPANVNANEVGPAFFQMLDIPLLAGRAFTDADTLDAPRVAIINESFAERFGLGVNPVGKRFGFDPDKPPDVEIVGVVRDSAYSGVKEPFAPQVVTPHKQSSNFGSGATFYVRTAQAPGAMLAAIPRIVASVDSSLPVVEERSLESQVRRNLQTDWLLVALAGVLATIATLLAAIGIYGVLSYMVAQRTREIGLRVALGAQAEGVRRMVMRQVLWMVVVGVPLGVAAALLIGDLASTLLFGLAATDPRAVVAAAVVLAIAVLGSSYWPARRASRVDPVVALRAE